ncbi:MAG: lysophospholipid acyltransferase family protein [Gemmatimonadota bacterium]
MRVNGATPFKGAPRWEYDLYCRLVRTAWKAAGGSLHVSGLENIPPEGPCFLIPNHQSYLEPLLIASVVPRMVHPMAKSGQFAMPVLGRLLSRVYGFPVRRHQVDAQAARTALRRLASDAAVMIFPEGERTWDGRLQPFRIGVLRLILKVGVPVVPVRVDNAYDLWPRWERLPRPGPLHLTFKPPLHFPKLERRSERTRAAVDDVRRQLSAALAGPLDQRGL